MGSRLVFVSTLILFSAGLSRAQIISSKPVMVFVDTVVPGEQLSVGINAKQFETSSNLKDLENGQITPSARWDAQKQKYLDADAQSPIESALWVENVEDEEIFVAYAGEVRLSRTYKTPLDAGLNLMAHSYAAPRMIGSDPELENEKQEPSRLSYPDASTIQTRTQLPLGTAYWQEHLEGGRDHILEPRPYLNPFVNDPLSPEIVSVELEQGWAKLSVEFPSEVDKGAIYELLYQDVAVIETIKMERSWQATEYEIPTIREVSLVISNDLSSLEELPMARFFMVVRSDIDSDGDGVSDAREFFVDGTDAFSKRNEKESDFYDPRETMWKRIDQAHRDEFINQFTGGRVYVSRSRGAKQLSGFSKDVIDGVHGPKSEIQDAITVVENYGVVSLEGGTYNLGGIDTQGKNIMISAQGGDVIFSNPNPRREENEKNSKN